MLITVSKKDTLNRLSGQFDAFTRGKKNITNTTKQTKHRVIRRMTREVLDGWRVVDDDDYNQSVGNPKWKV
jgi:hypothetical protein